MKTTFVLTCVQPLKASLQTISSCRSYIVGQNVKMPSQTDKNVLIPGIMEHIERAGTQVTQWLFTLHKPCLKLQETIADYTGVWQYSTVLV